MELIERDSFLNSLRILYNQMSGREGHCVFVSGEAGMGKTSLVKAFCREKKDDCDIFMGACDALFTPRPLAPLYDIIWQVNSELLPGSQSVEERFTLFTDFFRELSTRKKKIIIVFEDIHWADEATLDFIKYFARRISQLQCLFILTYRDNEIHAQHPLRNVLGQLPPDSMSRIELTPLSRDAVSGMAADRGYKGEDVYNISGGIPFYVNEILSSQSIAVPDNIKDSIIAAYNQQEEKTREIWELLAVVPTSFEIEYLGIFEPAFEKAIERCLESRVLLIENGRIAFKHELYRRAIETFLSPLKRLALNRKILDLFREIFEQKGEVERIIHHAKNANDHVTVAHYAPIAASQAACIGSHVEASKLYFAAIEYYSGSDKSVLRSLYQSYAYECYLTNQIQESIIYSTKALNLLKQEADSTKIGNTMRFLSRLWWLGGDRKKAETFAQEAIAGLTDQPPSPAKAMAYSNMSQLRMVFDEHREAIFWGETAIKMATEIRDQETLSHALNNVGSVEMNISASHERGVAFLERSLEIALGNSFHEHAARAYSNLGSNAVKLKNFELAERILDQGIVYCEERDLDSWNSNMLSLKSNLLLLQGKWESAERIATRLLRNENQSPSFVICALTVLSTIQMRRGEAGAERLLLDSKEKSFETRELQRIIPSLIALLEYEWLTGKNLIASEEMSYAVGRIERSVNEIENNEFVFWLQKLGKPAPVLPVSYEGYKRAKPAKAGETAAFWKKTGEPYMQAVILSEGTTDDKKKAISIVQELGGHAVFEKIKMEMRSAGIKSIPRGLRKATRENPAFLTDRELDVLKLLKAGMQNKEIASNLFIAPKTVDHHITSIFYKLEVNSRIKAVSEAVRLEIIK